MKTYRFILEIPARSEAEAKAKLDLLLQWAAFPLDLDMATLASSCLRYILLNKIGKALEAPAADKTNDKTQEE